MSTKLPKQVFIGIKHTLHGRISGEDYARMHQAQNGLCAICGKPETSQNKWGLKSLSVDHDHKTGKVRGLLCNACNLVLGKIGDDIDALERIAAYLRSTGDKQVQIHPIVGRGRRRHGTPDHKSGCMQAPNMRVLRERANIGIPKLGKLSGVSYRMIYRTEDGEYVSRKEMQKVLDVLNEMLGTNHTLDNLPNGSESLSIGSTQSAACKETL